MDTSFFDDLEALVNGHLTAIYHGTTHMIETLIIDQVGDMLLFPDVTTVTLVVCNFHADTMRFCPYFFVVTFGNGPSVPINYQFLHFLRLIGVPSTVSPRVETAVVVGCMDLFGRNLCSVPMDLLDPMSSIWDWEPLNLSACEPCNNSGKRCNLARPCKRCDHLGIECVPRDDCQRIVTLFNAVGSGNVCHHDLARYALFLEGRLYDTRILDSKMDVEALEKRLSLYPRAIEDPPLIGANNLPGAVKDMVQEYVEKACIRIEWLYNGTYYASYNSIWADNFYTFEKIRELQKKTKAHPKLIETLGCASPMRAYNMFVESLARMGKVVEWSGHMFWKRGSTEKIGLIQMLSVMHDVRHIITLTICEKLG